MQFSAAEEPVLLLGYLSNIDGNRNVRKLVLAEFSIRHETRDTRYIIEVLLEMLLE